MYYVVLYGVVLYGVIIILYVVVFNLHMHTHSLFITYSYMVGTASDIALYGNLSLISHT